MTDRNKANSTLAALVTDPHWIIFAKAMEVEDASVAYAQSLGLQWTVIRSARADEVTYLFKAKLK